MRIFITNIVCILLVLISLPSHAQISPGKLSNVHAHLEGIKKCTDCHVLGEKETSSKCLDCHKEIQNLIDQNRGYHSSVEVKDKKCAACHGEHYGREFEIVRFDTLSFNHELTQYKLLGKHASLNCSSCHKSELVKNQISQKKGGSYLGLGMKCVSCHEDVHKNTLDNNCTSCHNQELFKPAVNFEHSTTNYPLIGKHLNVDCEKCHKIEEVDGQRFQEFKGLKYGKCTDCHEDVHNNRFGNDCLKCHSLNSFNDANVSVNFNHEQTNYPLRGAHIKLDCKKCHLKSYTSPLKHQNCKDCHEDFHKGQFNHIPKNDCSDCHTNDRFTPTLYSIQRHNETKFILEGAHLAMPCFECHKKNEKWDFKVGGGQCTDCHTNEHENYLDPKFRLNADCKNCHSSNRWNQILFNHDETEFKIEGKHLNLNCRDCHYKTVANNIIQKFNWDDNNCTNCHQDIHQKQFNDGNRNVCNDCHTSNNWSPTLFDHKQSRFKLDGEHIDVNCIECHKSTVGLKLNYIVYKFKDISCASCH